MFKKKRQLLNHVADVYEALLTDLEGKPKDSKEYAIGMRHAETLHKLLFDEGNKVNINVVITAAANILGILLILNFEKVNVVASKALGLVLKLSTHTKP